MSETAPGRQPDFWELMTQFTVRHFVDTVGEGNANAAMLEWVKSCCPPDEAKDLEQIATEEPSRLHRIAAGTVGLDEGNLNALSEFLQTYQEGLVRKSMEQNE